jgi:type VI secretion system Hcp family effector
MRAAVLSAIAVSLCALSLPILPIRADQARLAIIFVGGAPAADKQMGAKSNLVFNCRRITFPSDPTATRDAAGGMPTGKRMHRQDTFTVVREVDAASPKLMEAMQQNRPMDTSITYYRTKSSNMGSAGAGEQKPYLTLQLKDARITNIESAQPPDRSVNPRSQFERISFTYRQITWTYMNGGKTMQDDWMAN